MFEELNELVEKNEQLEKENRELRRLSFQGKIQLLQSKITNLRMFANQNRDNLAIANSFLDQGLFETIDTSAYTKAIDVTDKKIAEYEKEIKILERQMNKLMAQTAVIQQK